MRVRCVKIISPIDGSAVDSHPSIQVGVEYSVLSISLRAGRPLSLQIITAEGPSYWSGEMFETTDGRIPDSWTIRLVGGDLQIGPEELLRPGFWEAYFDDEPAAVRTFNRMIESL